MKIIFLILSLFLNVPISSYAEEITPYKYTDEEREKGLKPYHIPPQARFTVKRLIVNAQTLSRNPLNGQVLPQHIMVSNSKIRDKSI